MDQLDGPFRAGSGFQYLPFNFAASWIVMFPAFGETVLTLSTDLNSLADEIRCVPPNYFLNVPTLLERVRRGVLEDDREARHGDSEDLTEKPWGLGTNQQERTERRGRGSGCSWRSS